MTSGQSAETELPRRVQKDLEQSWGGNPRYPETTFTKKRDHTMVPTLRPTVNNPTEPTSTVAIVEAGPLPATHLTLLPELSPRWAQPVRLRDIVGTNLAPGNKQAGRTASPLGVLMPSLLSVGQRLTGRSSSDVGTLTHALIGSHVQFVTDTQHVTATGTVERGTGGINSAEELLSRMYAVAYAVIDANHNAKRVLATEAASLAYRYLTEFPPAAPWELLGVEYDTGNGPVDLAWVNTGTGQIIFDEVKTSRVSTGRRVSDVWVGQARRYSAAGAARFGDLFVGTRLVPLMATNTTRLVVDLRPVTFLSPTAIEPLRPGGVR